MSNAVQGLVVVYFTICTSVHPVHQGVTHNKVTKSGGQLLAGGTVDGILGEFRVSREFLLAEGGL